MWNSFLTMVNVINWLQSIAVVMVIWRIGWCEGSGNQFTVQEETPAGTVLGSVARLYPGFTSPRYITSSQFVEVNKSGQLVLKQAIDLETVCGTKAVCCGAGPCLIKVPVVIMDLNDSRRTRSLKVNLLVTDVNDHTPRFSTTSRITVWVKEGARVGSVVALQGATDGDRTANYRVSHYELSETSGHFSLNQTDPESLRLVVRRALNYEARQEFDARLTACDSGQKCASVGLQIRVQDENDNDPVFQVPVYERRVPEDLGVGQEVVRVHALDRDGAPHNVTEYGYVTTSMADRDLVATFKLEPSTGSITLQRRLSASIRQIYSFQVFARDKTSLSGTKSKTRVRITVRDINDNKPVIKLIEEKRLVVKENAEANQEVVNLQVTDGDQGDNANVSCRLDIASRKNFRLQSNGLGMYTLTTWRKFDFEREKTLRTTITCKDHGEPPKSESKPLTIHVQDENEFAPRCEQASYSIAVKENRPPHVEIMRINGVDEDASANLTYSIHGAAKPYFSIDRQSGRISTSGSGLVLDKESMDEVEVKVEVSDGGARKGVCKVRVLIMDENDHDPVFGARSPRTLSVPENEPAHTLVEGGVLSATDGDKDSKNSEVYYRLTQVYGQDDSELGGMLVFDVTPSGQVRTLQQLDREQHANYTVTVVALDRGSPVRSARMNFTVEVRDRNDNAPEWLHPRPDGTGSPRTPPQLNLSSSHPPGAVVARLQAHDRDQGDNARMSYALRGPHRALFRVNSSSGELVVASVLTAGRVRLLLRASDHGHPPRVRDQELLVFVEGGSGDSARLNMGIILVLIGVTAVVALFLIVAIVCVQRKPHYRHHPHHSHHHQQMSGSQQSFKTTPYLDSAAALFGGMPDDCRSMTGPPPPSHTQLYADTSSLTCYLPHDALDNSAGLAMHSFVAGHKTNMHPYNMENYSTLPNQSRFVTSTNQFSPSLSANHNQVAGGSVHDIRLLHPGPVTMSTQSTGVPHNLDDDSADSGRGASEDDPGLMLHHQQQQQQQLLLMQHGDFYHQSTMPKARLLYSPTNLASAPFQTPALSHTNRLLGSPTNTRYLSSATPTPTNINHNNNAQFSHSNNTHHNHNHNSSGNNNCYVVTEEYTASPPSLATEDNHDNSTTQLQNTVTTFTQVT